MNCLPFHDNYISVVKAILIMKTYLNMFIKSSRQKIDLICITELWSWGRD